ncbi:hypothetical protein I540_1814 [Mycobacteroides abscessus subsp. bolletii 1513]|uniref:Uncharacterized protein n=1 Tax=Mycobacteroides abscessus subsp. bolletii 1513 TaxID=1299321 RepID=X8DV01_9MYCO|nr:hypothetical protein I540_1814 [Mycobacteroides abscessus subsp. bolletii 1513]
MLAVDAVERASTRLAAMAWDVMAGCGDWVLGEESEAGA